MGKNKYYAVRKGHTTGIFEDWQACQEAVKGFSSPDYKGFLTREEAEAYLAGNNPYYDQVKADISAGYVVAYTDGSFDNSTNAFSYGICIFDKDCTEINLCSKIQYPAFAVSRNISGEIFGVLTALDWAVSNGYDKIRIYHDLESISKWASGEYNANTDVSKFFVKQLTERFSGIIEYEFVKVPGHNHNPYNEKADLLAANALKGERKIIEGANSFTVGDFEKQDLDVIIQLCVEDNPKITITRKGILGGEQIKLKAGNTSVMVKLYNNKRLLVQGKPNTIYQMLVTYISELLGEAKIVPLVKRAYRIKVDSDALEANYSNLCPNLPQHYPSSGKTLIRQAIINLNGYFAAEEYGQYAFPALRALEGHIKYLFGKNGISVGTKFTQFSGDIDAGFTLKKGLTVPSPDKENIEACFNYYSKTRHKVFHFGDVVGTTDNTYLIDTKHEADEIIRESLRLINNTVH